MNKKLLLLWLTLREFKRLGLAEGYKGANIWSKTIFLLQEKGLPYGYWFIWYLYGPYSDQLREDVARCSYYEADHVFEETCLSEWKLSKEILQEIQRIVDGLRPSNDRGITLDQQILFASNCLYLQTHEDLTAEAAIGEIQYRHSNWMFDRETVISFLNSFPCANQSCAA